jgi:hypothetical protein
MSNRLNDVSWRTRKTRIRSIFADYVHQVLDSAGQGVIRQNAIRKVIASLIEAERMRLAMTIGNRDHK